HYVAKPPDPPPATQCNRNETRLHPAPRSGCPGHRPMTTLGAERYNLSVGYSDCMASNRRLVRYGESDYEPEGVSDRWPRGGAVRVRLAGRPGPAREPVAGGVTGPERQVAARGGQGTGRTRRPGQARGPRPGVGL